MKKGLLYLVIFLSVFANISAASIVFKENKGQWPKNVLYGSQFLNTSFFVTKTGFDYTLYNLNDLNKIHEKLHGIEKNVMIRGHHYKVNFINANLSQTEASEKQSEYYNYFIGRSRESWKTDISAYKNVVFKNVYESIDIRLHSEQLNLKYDFIIKPKGDVNHIRLIFNHVNGISLKNNNLHIQTSVGEVIEMAPVAWQIIKGRKIIIPCNYELIYDNQIGFSFPNGYDLNSELIIDPTIVTATYSGSSISSCNSGCYADELGNVYDLGYVFTGGYPTTSGAFQVNFGGVYDFIITKYSTNGTSKIFSTYLGSDTVEIPIGIHVNKTGINILGQTPGENFPVTINALDTSVNGKNDFTITKLSLTGNQLIGSTYIGGLKIGRAHV